MSEQATAIFAQPKESANAASTKKAAGGRNGNVLDLVGVCCPMNFVHAKLAIEKIRKGEQLEILLDDGEPVINVSRSLKDEGHSILKVTMEDSHFRLLVQKC